MEKKMIENTWFEKDGLKFASEGHYLLYLDKKICEEFSDEEIDKAADMIINNSEGKKAIIKKRKRLKYSLFDDDTDA
jgi:hypothetical protein